MKIVILGNSGSGKSTMAKRLAQEGAKILSLDDVAWNSGMERKPLLESERLILEFIKANSSWIIEGCYADLAQIALPFCSELIFLNPGVEACVKNCLSRPWESEKFESEEEQNSLLPNLIDWVKEYESREDEFGLQRHRALFDSFNGSKREYMSLEQYK